MRVPVHCLALLGYTCGVFTLSLAMGLCAGCSESAGELPIVQQLRPGLNDFELECPSGSLYFRVIEYKTMRGERLPPIRVSGHIEHAGDVFVLKSDEDPSAPDGEAFEYHRWIRVDRGKVRVVLDVEKGNDVVLVISVPWP